MSNIENEVSAALAGRLRPTIISTDALLADREKTHGDYSNHVEATWYLKEGMRNFVRKGEPTAAFDNLTYIQRESLDMIAHKIGRILAGDPNFRDHWDDIAGYAKLAADRCSK
jgi:hypothetical protein